MGRSGIVDVCVNGLTIYMESINANTDNMEWVRRKRNLASRFWRSSLHTALEYRKTGKTLDGRGMDWHDYALSGGSFPILLESGLPVGTITVSGMTEWEDHQTAADAISLVLISREWNHRRDKLIRLDYCGFVLNISRNSQFRRNVISASSRFLMALPIYSYEVLSTKRR